MQLVSFLVSKLHIMLSERHNGSSLFSLFLILISIPNSKTRVFNMSRGRIIESFLLFTCSKNSAYSCEYTNASEPQFSQTMPS